MERTLQEAFELADDIIESVRQQPPPPRLMSTGEKSLHEKLYDIYVEECGKDPEVGGLQSNVNLLEKLLRREALPCLVVNLYPENQGYSLMLKDKDGILIEPFPVPYLGQKLLEYLDAEELPSFLIDVLEKSPVNVFHHGCVIAEIRDYRQCSDIHPPGELRAEPAVSSDVSSAASPPPAYQTRHILLRPTMQSLVSDVESITSDNRQWTEEEKLELESQLILATAEPLCLDPSVAVACTANRLLFTEQKMNTDPVKQSFKRHASTSLDQQEVSSGCTCPSDLPTMTSFKKQAKLGSDDPSDLTVTETDSWMQGPFELTTPSEMDVQTYINEVPSLLFDDEEQSVLQVPEVKYGFMFDYEDDSQLWEMNPNIMKSLNDDPLFSADIGPFPDDSIDSHMYLPHMSLDDYSDDFIARVNAELRETVDICQGSDQSEARGSGKMTGGSSSSVCLLSPPWRQSPQPVWCYSVVSKPTTNLVSKPTTSLVSKPTTSLVSKPTTSLVSKPTTTLVPKPTISVVPKPATGLVPKPAISVVPKPAIRVVPKPAISVVPKPAISVVPKPAISVVPKPAISVVPKPAISVVPKPAISVVPKPATGPVPKPATRPVSKPATRPVSKPATRPVSKPATRPVSKPATGPVPKPATGPVPKPATVLVPKPATVLVPKPATGLVSKPPTGLVSKPTISVVPKPAASQVSSSVLEQESRIPPPLALTHISKQGSSTVSRGQDAPRATKTTTVVQQTTVSISRVRTLPPALQPSARSSENKPKVQHPISTTTTTVINVVKSVTKPGLVGNSAQGLGTPASVPAAAGITQNSTQPTRQQLPRQVQRPVKSPMQLIINNTTSPLTVKLPPGSIILRPEPQKPSQGQPQQIYVLIPKEQQTPRAPAPPQPVPPASSQGPNTQQLSLPAQQTSHLNTEQTGGARGVQPSQTSVVGQVGSTQQSHRQNAHSQSLELSATPVQQEQPQSQNVQLRIIPRIVTVSRPGPSRSDRGHAAGESSGRKTGGPPNTPKS
ncbi:Transcription factor SPT20 homolog [Apodemus speciosus]|uniref:Transcription factor SPT20 homolog n=1 Tax=Apodemus speciosus TaxID=105296 RepID=A0ABQ0FUP4_APOSI